MNQGFVHTLFDKKEDFIKEEIVRLKKAGKKLETAIETAENEHLNNEKEIDDLYEPEINRLSGYYGRQQKIQLLKEERDTRKENIKNKQQSVEMRLKEE